MLGLVGPTPSHSVLPPQRCGRRLWPNWYRAQIRTALPALLATWEARIGVRAGQVFVQKMKTKWGNPRSGNIRLNTELAKKPPQCLEYIVVHELIHLLEPHHNERFTRLMDQNLPDWRQRACGVKRCTVGPRGLGVLNRRCEIGCWGQIPLVRWSYRWKSTFLPLICSVKEQESLQLKGSFSAACEISKHVERKRPKGTGNTEQKSTWGRHLASLKA